MTISDGFEILPQFCFSGFTNLINLTLPQTLTTIQNDVFPSSKLQYLFIPKFVSYIHPENPFDLNPYFVHIDVDPDNQYFTSVEGIIYTKNMKTVIYCPGSINLTKLIVPAGVESSYLAAFKDTGQLNIIVFPETFTKFGIFNFKSKNNIKEIFILRSYNQKNSKYLFIPHLNN